MRSTSWTERAQSSSPPRSSIGLARGDRWWEFLSILCAKSNPTNQETRRGVCENPDDGPSAGSARRPPSPVRQRCPNFSLPPATEYPVPSFAENASLTFVLSRWFTVFLRSSDRQRRRFDCGVGKAVTGSCARGLVEAQRACVSVPDRCRHRGPETQIMAYKEAQKSWKRHQGMYICS